MKEKIIVWIALLVIFAPAAGWAKNIVKIGGDVMVERRDDINSVVVVAGQITVDGLVGKNVTAVGGSIILTSNAVVRGNVTAIGGIIAQGNGSQVFGDVTEINSSNLADAIDSVFRGELEGWSLIINIISVCFFAIILTIGLLTAFLLPRPLAAVAGTIENIPAKSFFWGFLTSLLIVPFFMLLAVSIIGIALIPLVFAAFMLAFIFGFIAVAALVGNFIVSRIFHGRKRSLVKETLIGLIVLWFLGWLPFYIGWIIKVFAMTFGLGGVLVALFNRRRRHSFEPPAQPAESEVRTPAP